MEPQLDFSHILEEAKDRVTPTRKREFVSQIAEQGIYSSEITESQIEVGQKELDDNYLLWGTLFLVMKSLYEDGLIKWVDFFTGEEHEPEFDFVTYCKYTRIVGEPSEPFRRAFPHLTEAGVEKYWKSLYKGYRDASERSSERSSEGDSMTASHFRRTIELDLDRSGNDVEDLDRAGKFAVLLMSEGSSLSTTSEFIVNKLLSEEDKNFLHCNGYITRVGSSTHKIYPYGKPTKANTSFHATPLLLKEYGGLMWSLFRKESIREGVKRKLEIDTKKSFEEEFLSSFNRVTRNGVQI